jgi:hypothetical protein
MVSLPTGFMPARLKCLLNSLKTLLIDKPPEEAKALKDFMRMRDDYFLEIPEDLKPKQIKAKLSELKTLCQSICEKTNLYKHFP